MRKKYKIFSMILLFLMFFLLYCTNYIGFEGIVDSFLDIKFVLFLILSIFIYVMLQLLNKKSNKIILNSVISFVFIFILNILIQSELLIFAGNMFGYGGEYYVYSLFSGCIYFIFLVGCILSIICCYVLPLLKKEKVKNDAGGNGLILFMLLTVIFTPSYSDEYLIYDRDNYVYNKSFINVIYSSDDSEDSMIETSFYIYFPFVKKYIIINSNKINVYSVYVQEDNTITMKENGEYIEYKISSSAFTES